MEVCRACLSSDKRMMPLSESFINGYNLLTNISVKRLDGLPQRACETCVNSVNCFVDFREQCIQSESSLQEQLLKNIKCEPEECDNNQGSPESSLGNNFDSPPKQESFPKRPRGRPRKVVTASETERQSHGHYRKNETFIPEVEKTDNPSLENLNSKELSLSQLEQNDDLDLIKEECEYEYFEICDDDLESRLKDFAVASEPNILDILPAKCKPNVPKLPRKKKPQKKLKTIKDSAVNESDFPCGLCEKHFETQWSLSSHLEDHKNDSNCETCKVPFTEWQALLAHRIKHVQNKYHCCHLCPKRFHAVESLEYHYLENHSNKNSIKCEIDDTLDKNWLEIEIEKTAKITEKPLAKRRVGRPRKATLNNDIQKSESFNENNTTTEAPIKRRVGRPRKNVSTTETSNDTWVIRPRQDKTIIQNTNRVTGCVELPRKNAPATSKSQKWVICPRKNATTHKTQNNEHNGCIDGANISEEKYIDNPLHEFEVLIPSGGITNCDLAIKEGIKNTDDNFEFDNFDTNASDIENELDSIKVAIVDDDKLAEYEKEEDYTLCDVLKQKTIKPTKTEKEDQDFKPCGLRKPKTIKSTKTEKEDQDFKPCGLRKPKTIRSTKNKKENEDYIPCGLCKKKLEDQESLSCHLDSHRSGTQCETCQETFAGWQALLAHRLQHVKSRKHHKCHICFKLQRSPVYFEYHYLSEHSDMELQDITMTCKVCLKKYSDAKSLRKHLKNSHRELRYTCDKCSKPFVHKFLLVKHLKMHTDDRPYVCDTCGYSSKFQSSLRIHILRKHTESSVNCNACSRVFTSKEIFEQHVCTGLKERVCPFCGIVTKFLKRHIHVHSDERKYVCKRCPATFKTKMALRVHTNRHDDLRPHKCEFCPMRFNSPCVLLKHRRVHTGEKPYVCKVCNKGFTGNHNLKVHMRVHGEDLVVKRTAPQAQEPPLFCGNF